MHPDPRADSGPLDFIVPEDKIKVEFHPGKGKDRYYLIDGEREIDGLPIVSVTTILKDIGDKFGVAAWWGQGVGVEGAIRLARLGLIDPEKQEPAEVVPLLTKHKLTTNHVRDAAGDRGTRVHAVAEGWANGEGFWPSDGYEEALALFIHEHDPDPIDSEVVVGSPTQAYAGTYDLEAAFPATPDLPPRAGLIDFKTKTSPPKGKPKAYEQHHLQLTAYEMARIEMGYEPTDFQAVCNLYPDGTYALIENRSTFHQWLACLNAYRALTDLRDSLKAKAA